MLFSANITSTEPAEMIARFLPDEEYVPGVAKAMHAALKETGWSKFLSARITVNDPAVMITRCRYDIHCPPAFLREALQWTSMPRNEHVEDLGLGHCEKWLGPLPSQSLACTQSHSVRLALPSGRVATSPRMTSLRAARFFCPVSQCIPEVVKAMQVAMKELGSSMLF
jgi:hypothetical protein